VAPATLGRFEEAGALLGELIALDEEALPGRPKHATHLRPSGELLIERERWREARVKIEPALSIDRRVQDANLGSALVQLAGAAARLGNAERARDLLDEAVFAGCTRGIGDESPHLSPLREHPRFTALVAPLVHQGDGR